MKFTDVQTTCARYKTGTVTPDHVRAAKHVDAVSAAEPLGLAGWIPFIGVGVIMIATGNWLAFAATVLLVGQHVIEINARREQLYIIMVGLHGSFDRDRLSALVTITLALTSATYLLAGLAAAGIPYANLIIGGMFIGYGAKRMFRSWAAKAGARRIHEDGRTQPWYAGLCAELDQIDATNRDSVRL